jgi:hypothetical protein
VATEEGSWVPAGEEADPPYDPAPVEPVEDAQPATAEEVTQAASKVPGREEIIRALDEFREPFAETKRRELAEAMWPELASLIWVSADQFVAPTPSTADLEPGSTSDLAAGVRWSDTAGCPVHIDATPDQEGSIADQAVGDANSAVDSIAQRWEELLDDTNLQDSVFTANAMKRTQQLLASLPSTHNSHLEAIGQLFETDWTGDQASAKGNEFFGRDVLVAANANQNELSTHLWNYATDDIRLHIALHASLAQTLYDCYNKMAEKTHLSLDVGVLQFLADALTIAGLVPVAQPYAAAATGFVLWLVTKTGDYVITTTWENVVSTNEVEKWKADLLKAADDAETALTDGRESLEADLATKLATVDISRPEFIPGEGYQDA